MIDLPDFGFSLPGLLLKEREITPEQIESMRRQIEESFVAEYEKKGLLAPTYEITKMEVTPDNQLVIEGFVKLPAPRPPWCEEQSLCEMCDQC